MQRDGATAWHLASAQAKAFALAALVAITVFALLLAAAGKDPLRAYADTLVYVFGNAYGFSELLVRMTPLVFTAVAVALPARIGLINVGGEGQLYMGACLATASALALPDQPAFVLLPLLVVLGFIGGGLWALVPGVLRALHLVNETISTLLLNYVAPLIVSYLIFGPWRDPQGLNFPTTAAFDPAASIPTLFEGVGRLHAGSVLTLIAVMLAAVLLGQTIRGFEIRVVGAAPRAARFSGFNADRLVLFTFAISGALAGLAGIIEVAGPIGHLDPGVSSGYGFTAIIVAFLGRLNPVGILVAGLFLALTFIGGESAQISMKVPLDLTKVFQGILLFYVLACDSLIVYRIRVLRSVRKPAHAAA